MFLRECVCVCVSVREGEKEGLQEEYITDYMLTCRSWTVSTDGSRTNISSSSSSVTLLPEKENLHIQSILCVQKINCDVNYVTYVIAIMRISTQ